MSNTDSFVEEVSDELRRDQLYTYVRRYGWIAVLGVLLIVGGAAYTEFSKASTRAAAEQFGGALDAAQNLSDPAAQLAAYQALAAGGGEGAILAQLGEAQALAESGDASAAAALLNDLRTAPELPAIYTDLAALKWAVLPGALPPAQDRVEAMTMVIDGGSPLSLLALEQRGLAYIELDDLDAAHSDFRFVLGDPLATGALRDRVTQMIIATGGVPGAAALTTQ